MKVQLRISKNGEPIYAGTHDIDDGDSFGQACAEAWRTLRQQQFETESSIGALMDHLDQAVLDLLDGTLITLRRA